MTIVGTRPELIKMSRVIAELDRHFHHLLVHTGQNFDYELNQIFFDDLEIRKPDLFLGAASPSPVRTIAEVLVKSDEVFERELPDALLLYGDTNSCLAIIAAKRRKIPVFHMEAGNRCFDQRVPEELNRKVVDHLADVNLVLSEHARRYLIAEGVPAELIFKTGSHMDEVITYYRPKIEESNVVRTLELEERKFFLVSAHREENVDNAESLGDLWNSLLALHEKYGYPVIFSTHPRTRKRLEAMGVAQTPHIRTLPPFGFTDYVKLQMSAACVLSDSGTLTEEAALLNFPAVMIRATHERPEGMDVATLIMCGLGRRRVLEAVEMEMQQRTGSARFRTPNDYVAPSVSTQIARIVLSYTDFVNRVVWHRASPVPNQ